MRRGAREAIIAIGALPVLLAAGVYVGGRLGSGDSSATAALRSSARAATPVPLVTVRPAPLVTVRPATPAPLVTVRPPVPVRRVAPTATVTAQPPLPAAAAPSRVPAAALPPGAGPVAPGAPPPGPDAVLGRGSAGAAVRTWQQQMAARGWRIAVDGVFGPQSERVARRFQREKGLVADGLVGPQTWTAAWRRSVTR